jgi:hypothetical protein
MSRIGTKTWNSCEMYVLLETEWVRGFEFNNGFSGTIPQAILRGIGGVVY